MSVHSQLYHILTAALTPLLPLWLWRRMRKGKEDKIRLQERYGVSNIARPEGQVFWMHGASVGEAVMLLPLIEALLAQYPKAHVLITSGTLTSAQILSQRLPARALHQYAPLDTRKFVRRFLSHWRPDAAIWAESEIWPNLVLETHKRNIPMALINARMSKKSLSGWARRQGFATQIFGCFDYIQAADNAAALGLGQFVHTPPANFGSLKDAAGPLPVDKDALARLSQMIGSRRVWCAASTHSGEDEIILRAHAKILENHPDALLVLAPRHPERAPDIVKLIGQHLSGKTALHSNPGPIADGSMHVYVIDTIGDMGLAYRLAEVTVMCGSLRQGLFGHNPLEPARLNNAVLTGPHYMSFRNIYEDMFAFGAAQTIVGDMDICRTISALMNTPKDMSALQQAAFNFAQNRQAVLPRTVEGLSRIIKSAERI